VLSHSCCSGEDSSCCYAGTEPWVDGAKVVDISPEFGTHDVKSEAWFQEDVPAPEGAYLGDNKAMVISCEHWDAQIGDHIGKSCGEGVYHELQESVGNTLGKFLSGEEEDKEMRRLTHNEKWNPSDRQTSLLRVQSETELSRGKSAVIKCAREHAHVYLWTEEPEEEEAEEEKEEKEKEKEEKKEEDEEHMKEEDEEEEKEREAAKDKGLWSDPIPDVVAWSKSHPPSPPSSEALDSTAAEAEEEKADDGEEEGESEGIMAVTVGKGFSKCISEHLAHTCSQLRGGTAVYSDWAEGKAYAVSGHQACREPGLLGSEGAVRLCNVCCQLSDSLCPAPKRL